MPDFFIVGAPKAGTTTIFDYLKNHEEVFLPKIKEPNFYVTVGPQNRNVTNIKNKTDYLKLYKKSRTNQITGDCSVSYLHEKGSARSIQKDFPSAKIIIIIRNPVFRAYSHWKMDQREGFTDLSFIEAFEKDLNYKGRRGFCYNSMYYDCSLYYKEISEYLAFFSDVLLLEYESFFSDLARGMETIYNFLQIENKEVVNERRSNSAGLVKNEFYKKLYYNRILRRGLKQVVPLPLKTTIRNTIMKKDNRKISDFEYDYVNSYFIEDYMKTKSLLV